MLLEGCLWFMVVLDHSWLFLVVFSGSLRFLVVPHVFLCLLGIFGATLGFLKSLVGFWQF